MYALVKQIWLNQEQTVISAPATYGAGAQNILTITGGPVWIKAIAEWNVTAMGGATTTTIAVATVGVDVGAVAIGAAAQDTFVVSPLDAAVAKIAPALAVQMPSLLGFATNVGIISGPGNITVTFAGAAMGAAERYSLIVVYKKLSPAALIA